MLRMACLLCGRLVGALPPARRRYGTTHNAAVTQNTSKTATMFQSLKNSMVTLFTKPGTFFRGRAYVAVAIVYSGWTRRSRSWSGAWPMRLRRAAWIASTFAITPR